jgi:hypothetical protein
MCTGLTPSKQDTWSGDLIQYLAQAHFYQYIFGFYLKTPEVEINYYMEIYPIIFIPVAKPYLAATKHASNLATPHPCFSTLLYIVEQQDKIFNKISALHFFI